MKKAEPGKDVAEKFTFRGEPKPANLPDAPPVNITAE